jgi:hypothetical protein
VRFLIGGLHMKTLTVKAGLLCAVIGVGALFGAGTLFSGGATSADDPAGKCGYYVNSRGNQVPRPCGNWRSDSAPPSGATARCRDGSRSWSQHPHFSGTCSYHGGAENYRQYALNPGERTKRHLENAGFIP